MAQKTKILLVDDTTMIVVSLRMSLSDLFKDDVEVRIATNRDAAMKEIKEFCPDICVVDVFCNGSASDWNAVADSAIDSGAVVLRTSANTEEAKPVIPQKSLGVGLCDKMDVTQEAAEVIRENKLKAA